MTDRSKADTEIITREITGINRAVIIREEIIAADSNKEDLTVTEDSKITMPAAGAELKEDSNKDVLTNVLRLRKLQNHY